jgi:lipoic acid synthetase
MPVDVPRNATTIVKPSWLKVRAPGSPEYLETKKIVSDLKLHTVCEEAMCPNIGECWSHHTATFMITGELCTRRCHFCSVKRGTSETLVALDPFEPERVGIAVKELGLQHAVVTSVDRDDVADNGASHFCKTVQAIHKHAPHCKVELLIPDLKGSRVDLETILSAKILRSKTTTLRLFRGLYKKVRPGAGYIRSLSIHRWAKEIDPESSDKIGDHGRSRRRQKYEVLSVMDDMRASDINVMTIGQYLRPSENQLPVRAFITPDEFKEYEVEGLKRGFTFVESGPFVRSSYHAWKHTADIPKRAE